MEDFSFLERLSSKSYASLTGKIHSMYAINGKLPHTVAELDRFGSLSKDEFVAIRNRGEMERKLDGIKDYQVMFVKTATRKIDTFVFARTGYDLGRFLYLNDDELGLFVIKEDFIIRLRNACTRSLPISAELAQIKNRKLIPMPPNRNSSVINLYSIKELCTSQEEILSYCENNGLSKISPRVAELTSQETRYDLMQVERTKGRLNSRDVKRILEGII